MGLSAETGGKRDVAPNSPFGEAAVNRDAAAVVTKCAAFKKEGGVGRCMRDTPRLTSPGTAACNGDLPTSLQSAVTSMKREGTTVSSERVAGIDRNRATNVVIRF